MVFQDICNDSSNGGFTSGFNGVFNSGFNGGFASAFNGDLDAGSQ